MKKLISGILILFMCGVTEVSFASAAAPAHTTTEAVVFGKGKKNRAGKRKKNGRYKKKRGLFGRKKGGCGCPKN